MSSGRLGPAFGARLDRTRRVGFEFNGRALTGFAGDTLASALLANGIRVVGRSFKLHRPRGIFSCGIEEPSCLVDIGRGALRTPNQRATVVELDDGLCAASVNCWPSVGFDLGAINGWFSALLPAGFYYKTFKWPSWHLFERAIRRMAGLGRASGLPDPDRYEEASARCDVAVIGGGICGLSAALAAAQGGANTLLVSSAAVLGGSLGWRRDAEIDALISDVRRAGVRILTRTLAFGIYDHGLVCARETLAADPRAAPGGALRERLWKIRAPHMIAAAGSFERPMLFPNNDRPGVMLAGAAEKYAYAYGVRCGERVVIAANSDSAYRVAGSLRDAGVDVVALIDRRSAADIGSTLPGLRIVSDAAIRSVFGSHAVRGCRVGALRADGAMQDFDCDLILSAGGHAPAVHLHSQAGGKLRWMDDSAMFVPDGSPAGFASVGACAGVFDRERAADHASRVGRAVAAGAAPPNPSVFGAGRSLACMHVSGVRGKQFVDLQNDVSTGDIGLAARENYRSVEHMKRYTTTGMGTDQGKTSNINALVLMGEITGRTPAAVGTTKFRPPFAPITLGLIAGRRVGELYRPLKRLPAHRWHESRGALFEQFGAWYRPAAYPQAGETLDAAAQREARAARVGVGIMDGSPLGKLEVFGKDAGAFLDLMYVGTMSTLRIGQARYGVLLNENGVLVDDGIVARLSEQHFWVNTTSAGIDRTAASFEEWLQCEYPDLDVLVSPVTSQWGNVTVVGPQAWRLLAAAGFDPGFAPQAMPHMTMRKGMLGNVPLRVLRASFSGELGYEINLPADRTESLFDTLWNQGGDFSAVPYGIEALEILRTEKGFIHIGTDTDGTTLPGDVGLARAIDRKKANFVGRRSLLRPAARDPGRLQLVALSPADGTTRLPVGAQIAITEPPAAAEGHVTSSCFSPTLGAPIALALLRNGSGRVGERILVHHLGARIEAVVVKAPFFDPSGSRLDG